MGDCYFSASAAKAIVRLRAKLFARSCSIRSKSDHPTALKYAPRENTRAILKQHGAHNEQHNDGALHPFDAEEDAFHNTRIVSWKK